MTPESSAGGADAATGGSGELKRDLGLWGAVVTGLGSIVGTGVFVSIAVAFGLFGREVLFAVPLAAMVATFNGLSSAQLAAAHPVSGGTYEYGYRFLSPSWGFTAGWLFLIAKTASASTAALGFAGYLGALLGVSDAARSGLALGVSAAVTVLILSGIRRTAIVNAVLVSVTIGSLVAFVVAPWIDPISIAVTDVEPQEASTLFGAIAFMFVAYTGYGRIATLGEEVRDPRRTIPLAVIATLGVSALLYSAVAFTAWRVAGTASRSLGSTEGAPLAALVDQPWAQIVEVGAIVAMAGVLLNLILGLSRVWLAMGRRNDMPAVLARVEDGSPRVAVILTGVLVGAGALVGDVRLTWSFSAFTVLLYYAITNAAALRLTAEDRRFPAWVSWAGLASCVFLSFWVDLQVWLVGVGVISLGWAWRLVRRRRR